jgi:prepilin-type N-terminal cleavage/methylation domain-containing protein
MKYGHWNRPCFIQGSDMTRDFRTSAAQGFSMVEVLMVIAIIGILSGAAAVVTPRMLSQSKADSAVTATLTTLRLVQERAVGERRNFDVVFTAPNRIQVYRVAVPPATGRTLTNDVRLETGQQFMQFPGVEDTPDDFGDAAPLAFGITPTTTFTSEGTFVDSSGDVLNGTIFLGHLGQDATSARAITIFGATGLVRSWRWDGKRWTE